MASIIKKVLRSVILKIGMLLLLITLVTFNVIIGANEKGLRVMPIGIILALLVVYLIILKIRNRDSSIFLKSKIDYLVLIFIIVTTLPLMFRTYVSYSDTVEFIMKYFFIYAVYILARNVIKEKRQIEYIIVVTLISSLIPILLYFDFLNKQFLIEFMKWANITYNKGTTFSSTFGYANTQAIYSAFCIFLAIHRFKINQNRLLKFLDVIYILFLFYIIWVAEAQTTMILLVIFLLMLFITKIKKQILKHKKSSIIGSVVILCTLAIYLNIALTTSKPILGNNEDIDVRIYNRFKQNVTYTLEIDFETECLNDSRIGKKLNVDVSQVGKYFKKTIIKKGELDTSSNIFKIEFTPTIDCKYIKLNIINGYYGIIKINNCYLNGERKIINYKFIPNKIGVLLNNFSTSGKSLEQRGYMYKDCLKIAKDSPIIGNGGNTWKILSRSVEDYKVVLKESHSYFFELLISYGTVGVIAFLVLIIYFFIIIFKQCKNSKEIRNDKIVIALGVFMLLLHSITFDFHMSFILIQLIVYIYMAVLLYDEENIKKSKINSVIEYFIIFALIVILSLYIRDDISKYLLKDKVSKHLMTPYKNEYYLEKIKDDIMNETECREILVELKDFMIKEPFYEQTKVYEFYFNAVSENLEIFSNKELDEYLSFGIQKLQTIRFKTPMYLDTIFDRVNVLANAINSLKKYVTENSDLKKDEERIKIINNAINELKEIINREYETNKKNIENIESGNYSEESRNNMKKRYQTIIESIE